MSNLETTATTLFSTTTENGTFARIPIRNITEQSTTMHTTTSLNTDNVPDDLKMGPVHVFITREDVKLVGIFLWVVLILIILGNLSCFYAVAKNLKSILTHPFFQSNVLCVYLSVVDVFVVILVGIPTAISYCVGVKLYDNFYTVQIMPLILVYLIWLQLLIITFISIDRAIHVMRPLQYRWGISKKKTIAVCGVCTITPFFIFILPYILIVANDGGGMICTRVKRSLEEMFLTGFRIPITCKFMITNDDLREHLKTFYTVCESAALLLTMVSLAVSNLLITFAIIRSQKMQSQYTDVAKKNMNQRIRVNGIVTLVSSALVLASVLPTLAIDWIARYIHPVTNKKVMLGLQLMVFFGPLFNPWIYPIRMASIRDFLISSVKSKRDEFVSSVTTSYMKLRSVSSTQAHINVVEPQASVEPVDLLLQETMDTDLDPLRPAPPRSPKV